MVASAAWIFSSACLMLASATSAAARLIIVILLGDAFLLQQNSIPLGRGRGQFGVGFRHGQRGFQLLQRRLRLRHRRLALRDLRVQIGSLDLDQQVAFLDVVADVHRAAFQIPVDACIKRRLDARHQIARQFDGRFRARLPDAADVHHRRAARVFVRAGRQRPVVRLPPQHAEHDARDQHDAQHHQQPDELRVRFLVPV